LRFICSYVVTLKTRTDLTKLLPLYPNSVLSRGNTFIRWCDVWRSVLRTTHLQISHFYRRSSNDSGGCFGGCNFGVGLTHTSDVGCNNGVGVWLLCPCFLYVSKTESVSTKILQFHFKTCFLCSRRVAQNVGGDGCCIMLFLMSAFVLCSHVFWFQRFFKIWIGSWLVKAPSSDICFVFFAIHSTVVM